MKNTRHAIACATLGLAAALAGCGGSSGDGTSGPPPEAPRFVQEPASQTAAPGAQVTLTAGLAASEGATWQWQQSADGATWTDIPGANTSWIELDLVAPAWNGHEYRVVATNAAGQAISAAATLHVTTTAPAMSVHPVDATVVVGNDARFGAGPGAGGTIATTSSIVSSLQWQTSADGGASWTDVAGAHLNTLVLPAVAASQDGLLVRLVATNAGGTTTSHAARLSVVASSTRALRLVAGLPGGEGVADLPGTQARFVQPAWTAVGPNGDVYVTSYDAVRRIAASGAVTTLAGAEFRLGSQDGLAAAASLRKPSGLAAGAGGELYVSDSEANVIRRIDPDGTVSTFAGAYDGFGASLDGTGAAARFAQPHGLAISPATGDLFVADTASATIRRITPQGVVTTYAGRADAYGDIDGAAADARFAAPAAVAVDAHGIVYVADAGNHAVRRIGTDGTVTTLARVGISEFSSLAGIAVDAAGTVYVADPTFGQVYAVAPDGSSRTLVGAAAQGTGPVDGDAATAILATPTGLAIDATGALIEGDAGSGAVRRIAPDGSVSTWAGALPANGPADGPGTAARFGPSLAFATDATGTIFVADAAYGRVRKVLPDGTTHSFVFGPQVPLPNLQGIALDAAGRIFLSDASNCVVWRMTPTGAATAFAGKPGVCGYADGTGANARFGLLQAMTMSASGELYAGDGGSIRRITADGTVGTFAGVLAAGTVPADGPLASATFGEIRGLAFDGAGNLYVLEATALRRISVDGQVSTIAGRRGGPAEVDCEFADGTGDAARLCDARALAVDAGGNAYVGDLDTVRRVTPAGVVSTVLGTPGFGSTRPGADPLVNGVRGLALLDASHLVVGSEGAVLVYTLP